MTTRRSKIKNYTSEVAPARSVAAIEELLIQAGAREISKSFDDEKNVSGFVFSLFVDGKPVSFKLPCKVEAVRAVLLQEARGYVDPGRRERITSQAQRTAWRLLYDWVAVQLTMIRLGQAESAQVFLPYAYDYASDSTVYDIYKSGGFKQLGTPAREDTL